MLYGRGKPGRWTELDLVLVEALEAYEGSLCPGCGQPWAHSSDSSNSMAFKFVEPEHSTCHVCQMLENKGKNDPPKAGVKTIIRNLMSWG